MNEYLIAGIGAGPANLSLAALHDAAAPDTSIFLERKPQPSWHPGLLFNGTRMQTSWVKDLVTLADPTNRFSFLNYLRETGRLFNFLIADFDYMPRREFQRYQQWVAQRLPNVEFGSEVTSVTFDESFQIGTADGRHLTAQHIAFGVGTQPYVPPCAEDALGDRVVVSARLADVAEEVWEAAGDLDVVVVGGGQTGAETTLELLGRGVKSIRWYSRRASFYPLDESPFANELFRPSYLAHFHALDANTRARLVKEQEMTSDGISEDTLRELFQKTYEQELVDGRDVVTYYPGRELIGCRATPGGPTSVTFRDRGGKETKTSADLVVLATGVRPGPITLDAVIRDQLELAADGTPMVAEDYSLVWPHAETNRIYVQNRAQASHGVADPNLSLLAVRSAGIVNSVLGKEQYDLADPGSRIAW